MNNILPKTAEEVKDRETHLENDAPEPEGAHDVQISDAKEVSNISKRAPTELPDQNFAEEVTKGDREDDPQVKVTKKENGQVKGDGNVDEDEDEAQVSDIDEPKEESHTITVSTTMFVWWVELLMLLL